MLEKLRNIFQVPELRRRVLFTLGMFIVYRLGEHVPAPGVNAPMLLESLRKQAESGITPRSAGSRSICW